MDKSSLKYVAYITLPILCIILPSIILHPGVDGEFEEGVVFGSFQKYKLIEPVCCSYYGATQIKLHNQSWLWFHYEVPFVKQLEKDKVYGFYYTSSRVQWATTRDRGEPTSRWLPYVYKIVDYENKIIWED